MKKILKLGLTLALIAVFAVGFLGFAPNAAAAETEEPLMRIAMFSDLHVEYDLQKMEKPIRDSIVKAVNYAMELTDDEGVDLVMVGGDMTGPRGTWKQSYIPKTTASIYENLSSLTKDGKVILVTGNHDPEPSVKVETPEGGDYSGDYVDFMTGACGEFVSDLYTTDIRSDLSPYDELLCYRYTINGIEFIGLNTPYITNQAKVCGLYEEQTEWLEEELEDIGKDKTVFIFCHYPYSSVKTIVNPSTAASSNPCGATLTRLLKEYNNAIYCYGHVHSGDKWWAKKYTTDIVKPSGTTTLVDRGVYKTNSFINAHMGSMGYYDNEYQPGGLSADDPLVVQFVMVEIYANRISFQVYNSGAKYAPGGKEEITPLVITRNLAAQMGLDPALGEYKKNDSTSSSTSSSSSASATEGDETVDTVTDTATVDSSVDTAPASESNLLPILLICGLGVVLVGLVVVAVIFLKKGKKTENNSSEQ